ncbi:YihY/virulence factor BrkB family protein [Paracoccus benzoatiresistens]|uniref:YihY/virulence factor BrkB family protein n=1 Tax=Paracoccus benzoatiresistens TaxID=2997341 RepID=A0ABT4J8Y3_9RHOB|nr:YihY/virulence factor BrkB family protein [Paracoccus sp. EF6]MCZ0963591.1 YihY/virulence factor BrkB family protein [Paracoccus sp. EF6]
MSRHERSVSSPDSGRSAETPAGIPPRGWKQILLRVKDEISRDHISVVSAGIAFYALLSIFPAIAALVSIAGLVLDPADIAGQLETVVGMLPEEAARVLQDQVAKVTSGSQAGTGLVALFGLAVALYGAMKGVLTLIEGLNIAYDEEETRGTVKLYLTALAITVCAILGTAASLGLMILLPALVAWGNLPPVLETVVNVLRWPLMAALAMLGLAALYRFGPSRAEPKWRWISIGAIVATTLWILGTLGFSIYVRNFGSYTETYGTLGGVIVLLTWMWLSAFVILGGAELNAETEQQTARDTTSGTPLPMGQRNAVKADTPPPGESGRSGQGPNRQSDGQKARSSAVPSSPKTELLLAILLMGSAARKLLQRNR